MFIYQKHWKKKESRFSPVLATFSLFNTEFNSSTLPFGFERSSWVIHQLSPLKIVPCHAGDSTYKGKQDLS